MSRKNRRKLTVSRSSITKLSDDIVLHDFEQLSEDLLESLSSLPQLSLFPKRKIVLDVLKEKKEIAVKLVEGLSLHYSKLYSTCKGKDAYLDLQIGWYDSIRSLASYAEVQCLEYAQIEVCPVLGSTEWLSVVTAVNDISKEDQFAMIHEIARFVYLHHHSNILERSKSMEPVSEEISATSPPAKPLLDVGPNQLGPLVRMCGSQMEKLYATTQAKLGRLKSSSLKYTELTEKCSIIDAMTMTSEEKSGIAHSYIPSTDRGGMRFPKPALNSFLIEFDCFISREVNCKTFNQLGKRSFQAFERKAEGHRSNLFVDFSKQEIFKPFSEKNVKDVYDTLYTKMLNLRKKDMQNSWERMQIDKRGGKSITLNLRDELKPYATRKPPTKTATSKN